MINGYRNGQKCGNVAFELNPRQRLRLVAGGVDFLGCIVRRDYRLVRRRVVNALKVRLREYRDLLVSEQTDRVAWRIVPVAL